MCESRGTYHPVALIILHNSASWQRERDSYAVSPMALPAATKVKADALPCLGSCGYL